MIQFVCKACGRENERHSWLIGVLLCLLRAVDNAPMRCRHCGADNSLTPKEVF